MLDSLATAVSSMSGQQALDSLDIIAQKWRVLAERRRSHMLELFQNGRWRLYYREEQFLQLLRDAVEASDRWAVLALRLAEQTTRVGDRPADAIQAIAGTASERVVSDTLAPHVRRRSAA
jgi:uncharacterized repeat protein (TIGR03809 family)